MEDPITIPDDVLQYYLNRTGYNCSDPRINHIIALAAQKFISEIANDALQYCKIRQSSPAYKDLKNKGKGRYVLTMEDLSLSFKEYGINVKKPEYFADRESAGYNTNPIDEKEKKETKERETKDGVAKTKTSKSNDDEADEDDEEKS